MTISSVVPVNNYTGNNSTTTFDFDFLIEKNTELIVTKYDSSGVTVTLTENVDYTIHEVGNSSGSYITFPIAGSTYSVLSPDEILTLSLELEIKQETPYPQAQNFEPPIVEKSLDYLTRLIQILNRKQERSIKVKESPTLNTEVLVNNIEEIKANLGALQNINNNMSDILSVNSNETNINTVSGISSDVTTVSGIATNITTTANNSANITTCVNNLTAINNASTNAQTASEKAGEALTSANSAGASASLAENWAVKTDGTVDGSEFSAKYYAQRAKDYGGVTYEELNANLGFKRGSVINTPDLFLEVKNYNHSTFDISKFSVTGTLTVADGVISGFSSGNYLSCSLASQTSNNIVIKAKFETDNTNSGTQNLLVGSKLNLRSFNGKLQLTVGTNGQYFAEDVILGDLSADTEYELEINLASSEMKAYLNEELVKTQAMTSFSINLSDILTTVGSGTSGVNPWLGSIDIKYLSVFAGGTLVFSGNKTGTDTYTIGGSTVSIPYVLSSTGSKIVDSAYRTDVQSVYEANGSALYYTIDETEQNVTLPAGEIYGFIRTANLRKPVEIYNNGAAGYKVFEEYNPKTGAYIGLWCEEWGETNGTSGERNISFTNTFKDTNYTAGICYGITNTFSTAGVSIQNISLVNASQTGFSVKTGVTNTIRWKVSGYLA